MSKLTMLAAGVAGYVLGTKAGRTRYEQIRSGAQRVTGNPKVQEAAHKASETVHAKAPGVKDKVASAASKVKGHGHGGGDHSAETGWPADPAATSPDSAGTSTTGSYPGGGSTH